VRARDGGDARLIAVPPPGDEGALGGYSPDGRYINFWTVTDGGDSGRYVAATDGSGTVRRITDPSVTVRSAGDWSPDGNEILFSGRADSDHRATLWTVRPDGTHLRQVRVRLPGPDCGGSFADPASVGCASPTWSPDGRYLVYLHVTVARVDLQVATASGRYVRTLTDRMDDGGQRLDVESPDWQPVPRSH
jgi:Tol biopolymer transport system component